MPLLHNTKYSSRVKSRFKKKRYDLMKMTKNEDFNEINDNAIMGLAMKLISTKKYHN